MAAYPKDPQKMNLADFTVDRKTYDNFVRICSGKGFAPKIILERLMAKYCETGNI